MALRIIEVERRSEDYEWAKVDLKLELGWPKEDEPMSEVEVAKTACPGPMEKAYTNLVPEAELLLQGSGRQLVF